MRGKSAETRLALAKSNGFVPGATLPRATERKTSPYSLQRQEEVLVMWKEYLEACEMSEHTNPTDELCKNFIRFYATSGRGRITDGISRSSVQAFWKYCSSALDLSLEIKQEGYNYINNDLDVSDKTRIRHIVSGRDIDNLLRQLWTNDAFEWPCPRVRIQVALWLCLQAASGQRGGTFSESACYRGSNESLWYKDTLLYLAKQSDGREVLHPSVGMRFRKGVRQSARSLNVENLPSVVFYEHDDPVRSIITYFISLALADKAFKTVQTIDDIVNAKIPPGHDMWVFEWESSIGEMPVFQEINDNGPTGKAMTYSMIKDHIVQLGHRAGYSENITMHAIRRAFLNSVNVHYSTAQRNQVAGHSGRMFEKAYQSHVSNVDGYAMMTGKDAKVGHASILQSMTLFHRAGAPAKLPTKIKDEMSRETDYRMILDQIEALTKLLENDRGNRDLLNQRRVLYHSKSWHERNKLLEYQKMWSYQQQSQSVDHDINNSLTIEAVKPVTDFSILRSFMPERDRLADSLFKPLYVREGRQILEDLLHLARAKNSESFYRPGEEPIDGKCPFNNCKQTMNNMSKIIRSNHIHHCHKKELREDLIAEGASNTNWYPRFCYHCNRWILNAQEWSEDCERHMDDPPVYCNVLHYRHVLIRSGLCPFCLGEENRPAAFRFKAFRDKADLKRHLDDHLQLLEGDEKLFCPHPKCRHSVNDKILMDHFESIHSITPARRKPPRKSSKRQIDTDSEEIMGPKKKKKTSRKINNSSKSQNKHNDASSLDDQLENLKHSNISSPDVCFEDFDQENLFADGWDKDWGNWEGWKGWKGWEGKNCSLANSHDEHNGTSLLDDQLGDLKHIDDRFEDFNQESLFVDGKEKGWEDSLDEDQWAVPYYDTVDIVPDFSYEY